jgi:hypothetical protein
MTASFLMRLLLALVLLVNGTGGVMAFADGQAAPAAMAHGEAPAPEADATAGMSGCHEAAANPATAAPAEVAAPAHGHCCHDACHCVCTLQAHALATLPAPVPSGAVARPHSQPGWAAPDPALLLRPPIA